MLDGRQVASGADYRAGTAAPADFSAEAQGLSGGDRGAEPVQISSGAEVGAGEVGGRVGGRVYRDAQVAAEGR